MTSLVVVPNITLNRQVSTAVYELVLAVYQQQPQFLLEKHRSIDWSKYRYQAALTERMMLDLSQATNKREVSTVTKRYLRSLFVPDFFQTELFQAWRQQLLSQVTVTNDLNQRIAETEAASPLTVSPLQSATQGIAILLLDGENLKLSVTEEIFIQKCCQYPLFVKVAFANWRSMGRYDIDFHERGYQMIHVPAGKNAADLQMTAIGASLFLQYPHAKEAVVCSSDSHLLPLCNLLQNQGLSVFSVRKSENRLAITHYGTGRTAIRGIIRIETSDELEQVLIYLLKELMADASEEFVEISSLGTRFKEIHGKPISEVLKELGLGSKYVNFLKTCTTFTLTQRDRLWYISLASAE